MTLRNWAVRILYLVGGVFVFLVLLTFLAVQTQQRILRWRAERLLADMHQIRLYQSTWADAQQLMHRWGAWGYYEGSCTAANCAYEIELRSLISYNRHVPPAWLVWLLKHDRMNVYEWFGGRGSVFRASFTVHDGTIWRESTCIGVCVPRKKMKRVTNADTILTFDDFEWTLSVGAVSYQRLHRTLENPFLFTVGDESLAGHPYYKVGRPSGCKILCQIVDVYYSTRTPPAEMERLTSYDFSCFTRFHPCARIADLLPAAEEWHLYDSEYESGPTVPVPKERPLSEYSLPKPVPCSNIPVWAQARDAHYALAVEALSTEIVQDQETHQLYRKVTKVRVVDSLKGPAPAPWLPGAIVNADNREWFSKAWLSDDLHLVPGRRYIVFPIGNDSRHELVTKDTPLSFERCGVRDDTPEIRREVERGFAQNDTLNP
jgi:hypothetical protein